MAALDPITGVLGHRRAAHLLRRVTFGPTKREIDEFANLEIGVALDRILTQADSPEAPIDLATGQFLTIPQEEVSSDENVLDAYFKAWWLERMRTTGTNITERMTYFWHTHFTTKTEVVQNTIYIYYQNELMRQFALGNFKDLTKKVCLDNAMLVFLDSNLNQEGNPNENFARELLELYTAGKGNPDEISIPDDYINYTEEDVQAAAKVLSGYTDRDYEYLEEGDLNYETSYDPDTGLYVGELTANGDDPTTATATQHDASTKQFSTRFASATITPPTLVGDSTTVEGALDELDQLLDIIFEQEDQSVNASGEKTVALHMCRKLYRFFMYYEITDEVETNVIQPLAETFYNSGYEILPVLEELLASQHFYDEDNGVIEDDNNGAIIKSPLEVTLGILRFLEVNVPDETTDLENFNTFYNEVISSLELQGIDLYNPFEVAGYAAYHQEPGYNRNWISANYLTQRYRFIDILRDSETFAELGVGYDILDFVNDNISTPSDANVLVSELIDYLLPEVVTEVRVNYFVHVVFLGLQDGDYDPETYLPVDANADLTDDWERSWNDQDETELTMLLDALIRGLLQSPEYQLF